MADYYRDRVRHGGILSNTFITRWYNRQVGTNQYGLPGRAARNWGEDTVEGDLSPEVLEKNRRDQRIDTAKYKFRDEDYYASKDFDLEDIEVPLLSVANWVSHSQTLLESNSLTAFSWIGWHCSSFAWRNLGIPSGQLKIQVPSLHHWPSRSPLLL